MLEYLSGILRSGETFTVSVRTVDGGFYSARGVLAVDSTGIALGGGSVVCVPWATVTYVGVDGEDD